MKITTNALVTSTYLCTNQTFSNRSNQFKYIACLTQPSICRKVYLKQLYFRKKNLFKPYQTNQIYQRGSWIPEEKHDELKLYSNRGAVYQILKIKII